MANSESFIMEVIAQAEARGVDATASALVSLQKQVDQLARHTGMAEKDLRKLSSALETVSGAGSQGIKKQLSLFQQYQAEIKKTTRELQELAAAAVEGGSTTPRSDLFGSVSLDEAERYLAVLEAERVSTEQVARDTVAAEKRKSDAVSQYAADRHNHILRVSQFERDTELATLRDIIKERARAAEVQGGRDYGNLSVNIDSAIDARKREASAWSDVVKARMNDEVAAERQAAANDKVTVSVKEQSASLPTLRYAMYDVAQTAGIMSAAIAGAGAALLTASASYESAFTAVERTTGAVGSEVETLRSDFLQLSREIPQAFSEIANIGARGAQLGIANDQLKDFTETVAQFVATSDTVSLDQAVESFGRISNLMGDTDFNRIGSAITLVGVNAAATEAQIVKTAQELAPFATAVGLSTDEVIALAAALGSLGQPPERARSAFLTLQRVMDNAVSSGSENLSVFASLLGQTEEQVAALWKQDPGQFIESFSSALGSVEDLTATFEALGINERRAVQVFQALAADSRNAGDGVSVLSQAMADANKGYSEGIEMARQYGLIVDDLASKWQLFLNSVAEFAATAGDALAPLAKVILDVVTWIVQGLSDIASTPFGSFAIQVTAAVGALTFVVTSLIASLALSTASLAAMGTGLREVNRLAGGSIFTIRGLRNAFTELSVATGISSGALRVFRGVLASTGIGLAVLAVGALAAAFMQAGATAEETASKYLSSTAGLAEAIQQDTADFQAAVAAGNTDLANSYQVLSTSTQTVSQEEADRNGLLRDMANFLNVDMVPGTQDLTSAIDDQTIALGANVAAWAKSSLMQSDVFQELMQNSDFTDAWAAIGADFDEVLQVAAVEGEQGVLNYFQTLANSTANGGGAYLQGLRLVFHRIGETFRALGRVISDSWDALLSGRFGDVGPTIAGGLDILNIWSSDTLQQGFRDIAQITPQISNMAQEMGKLANRTATSSEDLDDWGDSADEAGDSAGKASEKVRTLLDYASDLSKVWSRAFDIRFSGQSTLDSITSTFLSIRQAADDAARRIRDLNNDIRGLASDIDIQEYFLSIAIEYGDTKRAEAIEADLAKMRAELADKTTELKKEQDANSKSLVGNSKGAIENRKQITSLVQQYQAHIEALAASGMSQDDLARATARLRQDFINQATQLGYNRKELEVYARAFDDVSVAISKVPRNITVTANANPAIQAFNEYATRANDALNSIRANAGKAINFAPIGNPNNAKELRRMALEAEMLVHARNATELSAAGGAANMQGARLSAYAAAQIRAQLASGNYYTGGYTGAGGKYEPAGIVHKGEYVIPKHMVNQTTGLPYADALGRLMGGIRGYASGGATAGSGAVGTQQVALTAGTIQAIAHAVKPILMVDGQQLGEVTSRAYSHENTVGAY